MRYRKARLGFGFAIAAHRRRGKLTLSWLRPRRQRPIADRRRGEPYPHVLRAVARHWFILQPRDDKHPEGKAETGVAIRSSRAAMFHVSNGLSQSASCGSPRSLDRRVCFRGHRACVHTVNKDGARSKLRQNKRHRRRSRVLWSGSAGATPIRSWSADCDAVVRVICDSFDRVGRTV